MLLSVALFQDGGRGDKQFLSVALFQDGGRGDKQFLSVALFQDGGRGDKHVHVRLSREERSADSQ